MDLAVIWFCIIGLAVLAYIVLDGFDLGIGILFPAVKDAEHRDVMVNSIAPVWDGNETWLILGGGGLFAAFPLAYSILMPALYIPVILMLLGLIFRGVAFEFRFRTRRSKHWWDLGFVLGSYVAAFCQGMIVGAFVQGITVDERAYAGGNFDWVTPFTLLTGVSVVVGYALLGCTWLIGKTEGDLQARCRRLVWPLVAALVGGIVLVTVFTPLVEPAFGRRWFSWPTIAWLAPVPLLVAALAWGMYLSIRRHHELAPFLCALGFFILSFVGLAFSVYPYLVPRSVTLWDAAAPPESLGFLLIGTLVLLPVITIYTGYAYWVFRGKVRAGEGYHH